MATTSGQSGRDVGHRLLERMEQEPHRFRFFQMIRLLERFYPGRKAVGQFAAPREEVVRFSSPPTLAFPASEVSGASLPNEEGQGRVDIAFMGLHTINGPMPEAQTATLMERERQKDHATRAFFDIFNHRLVSLFYRAWKRYRFFISVEAAGPDEHAEDPVTARLYDLVGLGTPGLRGRMAIPDGAAVFYAGLLSQEVRSASGLGQILEDYFGVPVEVRQFTGVWERLPPAQQTFLRASESFCETLGSGTVVGNEVWNQQGSMTIRLGPMSLERYRHFLPGSRGQEELHAWLRFYSRGAIDFVVQLVLAREEVPQVNLVPNDTPGVTGARLGYESWLKVKPFSRDPDETTYMCNG